MEDNWVKVYSTENAFTAEVLKQGLTENEIPAVALNKKIGPYNLGVINIMVQQENFDKAMEYIQANDI